MTRAFKALFASALLLASTAYAETPVIYFAQADRLEYRDHEDAWLWDLQGWIGGDEKKFWWKTEGELEGDNSSEGELQALYSKAISPFFDLQLGLRHDVGQSVNRNFAVIGIQGLAPQWFEIDAAAFLSEDGDLSARFEAEYDLRLTQRLILQPRFEINIAASDVPELALGSGVRNTDIGIRLRYEFRREIAPYIGFSWHKLYGETKDTLVASGGDDNYITFVAGARLWF